MNAMKTALSTLALGLLLLLATWTTTPAHAQLLPTGEGTCLLPADQPGVIDFSNTTYADAPGDCLGTCALSFDQSAAAPSADRRRRATGSSPRLYSCA